MSFKRLTRCLCCDSDRLRTFFSLGDQPLVNNLSKDNDGQKYELAVNVCLNCGHNQLTIAVNPEILFSNYLYLSGASQQHRDYFKKFASKCSGKSVLDIGCNDGSLLECFEMWDKFGVEPARNLKEICDGKGIKIYNDFFPTNIDRTFDVITAFNVFAHNSDPYSFLYECIKLLSDEGTIYIQVSQKDMIRNGEFDTIYHEHISYFTINSMSVLCNRLGVVLDNVDIVPMHGVSYLFEIRKKSGMLLEREKFAEKAFAKKKDFKNPGPVVGYGASAKGIVAMNFIGILPEYVVDDNELKQDMVIPGVGCSILPSTKLSQDERDLNIIIFAWNMYDEIMAKIKQLRPGKNDTFLRLF